MGLLLQFFSGIAALFHCVFFYVEAFRVDLMLTKLGDAPISASLQLFAFNQGFYNLFLAIFTIVGIMKYRSGKHTDGFAILTTTLSIMLLAALVLVYSVPALWKGAMIQGGPPALGLLLIMILREVPND